MEKLKIHHIQKSLNPRCYREQLLNLQEMIEQVFILKLVHYVLNLMVIFTLNLGTENEKSKNIATLACPALPKCFAIPTDDVK